jgi:palmitoyltransferase
MEMDNIPRAVLDSLSPSQRQLLLLQVLESTPDPTRLDFIHLERTSKAQALARFLRESPSLVYDFNFVYHGRTSLHDVPCSVTLPNPRSISARHALQEDREQVGVEFPDWSRKDLWFLARVLSESRKFEREERKREEAQWRRRRGRERMANGQAYHTNAPAGRKPVTAPELMLKILLAGTQAYYENRGVIDEARLEVMLKCGKTILWKSHQEGDVRADLGFSPEVWRGLVGVLDVAVGSVEGLCFVGAATGEGGRHHQGGSSSELIARNYAILIKDIERLNDLCTIARNLLATTKRAQNLAAEFGFDQGVLRLIDACVRVSSRGFDGEVEVVGGQQGHGKGVGVGRNEEKWQKVVNLCKRLLITCLQFLHNFVMHNEQRKLVLWLDLFGNARGQQGQAQGRSQSVSEAERLGKGEVRDELSLQREREKRVKATAAKLSAELPSPEGGLGYNIDDVHALFDLMSTENQPDADTQEAAKRLMDKIRTDMEALSGLSATQLDEQPEKLLLVGERLRGALPAQVIVKETSPERKIKTDPITSLPELGQYSELAGAGVNLKITDEDLIMPRTSASAAETLREAKEELMTRLRETSLAEQQLQYNDDELSKQATEGEDVQDDADSLEAEASEEEDLLSDEDDVPGSTSPERGLLTDVPLVLGPTEIEALPMIIQAGIVDLSSTQRPSNGKNMQAVRTHILLASVAGRNLLRELLIFIAAWDLPDDEFYFKMMVQIMEGILSCGLMSHAYSDFGQAKDIISPAQAVAVKILTSIFRSKYSPASVNKESGSKRVQPASAQRLNGGSVNLARVDVLTVRYIFTVFRGNIIPETCALIYLQGQIKNGLASAEDFPLNLWDMERVYEGVYQFLEFFAVLTESADWKALLVEWEIVYDLVTLMRELEGGVQRGGFVDSKGGVKDVNGGRNGAKDAMAQHVEQPQQQASDDATASPSPSPSHSPPPPLAAEDPALFEWRNLKKLIVLVLSSLVWKCPTVQDQIREYGGLDVILGCTMYDAHNPYIKEHAVMCLKFLLEGNERNQRLVGELEGRGQGSVNQTVGGRREVDGRSGSGRVVGEELDDL